MSVSGELRVWLIRCTGRYDNRSFFIKTPFLILCNDGTVGFQYCTFNLPIGSPPRGNGP